MLTDDNVNQERSIPPPNVLHGEGAPRVRHGRRVLRILLTATTRGVSSAWTAAPFRSHRWHKGKGDCSGTRGELEGKAQNSPGRAAGCVALLATVQAQRRWCECRIRLLSQGPEVIQRRYLGTPSTVAVPIAQEVTACGQCKRQSKGAKALLSGICTICSLEGAISNAVRTGRSGSPAHLFEPEPTPR